MMKKGLYILDPLCHEDIYGPTEQADISRLVDVYAPPQTCKSIEQHSSILSETEVIFSGWGAPRMDKDFLAAAPNLKAVFYGAGSVKGITTDAFWNRGIILTSAAGINAIPVAEYTLSQILFSLKRGWQHVTSIREKGLAGWQREDISGAYGSKIGIVSLGMIGRRVCELLRPLDVEIIAFDPYVRPETAKALGVRLCSLKKLFKEADVVSLHTPILPETNGLITAQLFASMKKNATFINTARGAVVNEKEMAEILAKRPDLWAILDVTHPEPPDENSPLFKLPNVILTPHIAGSLGKECRRMGRFMVQELQRYLKGEPLSGQITREASRLMA